MMEVFNEVEYILHIYQSTISHQSISYRTPSHATVSSAILIFFITRFRERAKKTLTLCQSSVQKIFFN